MQGDKEVSLVIAAKDFFGLRTGTTLKDFTEEWKALNEADKAEIRKGLEANGYNIKA